MKLKDFDFRIWDNQTNKFIEFNISDNIRAVPRKNDDLDLELWSGICDKNGTKIYENDIVRAISGALLIVGIDEDIKNWIVTNTLCQGIGSQALMQLIDHTEVVGNIHENADLLDNHNKEQECH